MFQLLHAFLQFIEPFLVPSCLIFAWSFILILGWSLWSGIRETTEQAKRMHQIPCANCRFFTEDYRLKCTVQPLIANTEQAIDCSDYRP